jgi:glycosyltransferase involved in cell wall biosynthesis
MKFSVIIPSYLGEYRTAAKDRDKKIVRAIYSVLNQSLQDFEVIVVADGCEKTVSITKDLDVKTILIPKSKLWSGEPRNTGIQNASGDYIIYLDIDDVYGGDHLKNISDQLGTYDWVWFDDIRYSTKQKVWYENPCDITQIGRHGTSNICHKRNIPVKWDYVGYAHDYYFVLQLRQNGNFAKINDGEYYVCHIPNADTGGYDL